VGGDLLRGHGKQQGAQRQRRLGAALHGILEPAQQLAAMAAQLRDADAVSRDRAIADASRVLANVTQIDIGTAVAVLLAGLLISAAAAAVQRFARAHRPTAARRLHA